MPKLRLVATTTTQLTTEVKLSPTARAMALARCEEHAKLAKVIKAAEKRQKAIKGEVETLFMKEKQGKALANGTELAGYKIVMVCGSRNVLDKKALVELGCDPEWLVEATESVPNKEYVKITAPGEEDTNE